MRSKLLYLLALLIIFALASYPSLSTTNAASAAPNVLTGYYNLMGYEGIAMIGENLANYDPTLPFDNLVPTHCRSTDLDSLDIREYYPRYLLHLPDGVTLPQIDVHIADFVAISSLGVELSLALGSVRSLVRFGEE